MITNEIHGGGIFAVVKILRVERGKQVIYELTQRLDLTALLCHAHKTRTRIQRAMSAFGALQQFNRVQVRFFGARKITPRQIKVAHDALRHACAIGRTDFVRDPRRFTRIGEAFVERAALQGEHRQIAQRDTFAGAVAHFTKEAECLVIVRCGARKISEFVKNGTENDIRGCLVKAFADLGRKRERGLRITHCVIKNGMVNPDVCEIYQRGRFPVTIVRGAI